jgi:hypothetical protein
MAHHGFTIEDILAVKCPSLATDAMVATMSDRKLFGLENLKGWFDNFAHSSQIYCFKIFRYLAVTYFKSLKSHQGQIYIPILHYSSANFKPV